MNAWIAIKRPALLAFFLGCTISFLTTRTLTLRLIVPSMIYWSFVPLIEIAALAVVRERDRQDIPFPEFIDLFFKGYSPWLLWLVGVCAVWSLFQPSSKSFDWTVSIVWLLGGVATAIAWSLYIDFCFFRSVMRRSRTRAMRELAIQRLIAWPLIMVVVAAPTIWSGITGSLW
jgi:hypothetical protein